MRVRADFNWRQIGPKEADMFDNRIMGDPWAPAFQAEKYPNHASVTVSDRGLVLTESLCPFALTCRVGWPQLMS
jgi:hypothetical protein